MSLRSGITFFPSETSWSKSLGSIEYDENEKHFKFLHEDEKYTINLPAGKSGTVALTSDIDSKLDVITYEKELSYTGDRGTLPDDLKALILPYYNAKKPFIFKNTYDSENTFYYLKSYDGTSDGEIILYFWEDDTQNQFTLSINLETNTFIFGEYSYALYEYVVHSNINKKVVYANDENGRQAVIPYSLLPGESNIAQFDTNGHLYTNDPSIDSHCANKKYVDSAIKNNLPYGTNADIDNMF